MSYPHVTPRDLLAINPLHPGSIRVERIMVEFGVGRKQAYELRALAEKSPHVQEARLLRLIDPKR